jgi:hypothetical protein
MNYNFKKHKKGDTFDGVLFTMNINDQPLDLTGYAIKMQLRVDSAGPIVKDFEIGNGLTIIDALLGNFRFDEQIIDIPKGTYLYNIQFISPSNKVKTYIEGQWVITQDITY